MTTLAAAVATAADTRSGTTCPRRHGGLRWLLRPGTATALAALLIAPVGLSSPAAAAAEDDGLWNGRLVLDRGHVDALHLTVDDGALGLSLREDVTGQDVVHDPADVVLQVVDAGQVTVPDAPGYEFLGAPGDTVWLIPEIQDPAVVWAGWDTEEVPAGTLQGDTATLSLTAARGPGEVHVFTSGPNGEAQMVFDPADGPTSTPMPTGPGHHQHANWTFSAPGTYELTVTADAVRADGTPLHASDTYLVVVGPLPPEDGGTPTDPTPTDPTPTDPTPTDPTPTDPTPTDPTPTPTDPTPTDPTPTDPDAGQPQQPVGWDALPPSGRHVLSRGHVDIRSVVSGPGIAVQVRDDTTSPPSDRGAEAVTFVTAPGARTTSPRLAEVLGAGTTTAWVLPQTQVPHLLWPGWNVEFAAGAQASTVRWDLLDVRGPGELSLFQSGATGALDVVLTSVDGGPTAIEYRDHAHANWAFGAEGVYCLDSAFTAVGTAHTDTATLLFAVGAVDPAKVTEAMCGRTPEQIAGAPAATPVPLPGPEQPAPAPVAAPAGQPVAAPTSAATPGCTPVAVTRRSAAVVATSGHFDFGAQVVQGRLVGLVADDRAGTTWRDPAGLVFQLRDTARVAVPAGADYAFLGAAGGDVWLSAQTQQAGVPWLGWNTQHPSLVAAVRGGVTLTMGQVSGPGRVEVFTNDSFGGVGQRLFSSSGGPRTLTVPLNAHQHANWAFTAPGVYRVPITQTAQLASGGQVSATSVLSFAVGAADPASAGSATVTDWVGRTDDGRECALDATQRAALSSAGAALPGARLTAVGEVAQLAVVAEALQQSSDGVRRRSASAAGTETAAAGTTPARPWPLVALTAGTLTALAAATVLWVRRPRRP